MFGTLISLLDKGEPILGIIDQPILKERWLGAKGRDTTLNGERSLTSLHCAKGNGQGKAEQQCLIVLDRRQCIVNQVFQLHRRAAA